MVATILKGIGIAFVMVIVVTVFSSFFDDMKQTTLGSVDFEKAGIGLKSDYCLNKFGVNYSYHPSFSDTKKYCSAWFNSTTSSWGGLYLVNNSDYQLWLNSDEQQVLTTSDIENILDPILFIAIWVLMITSLFGVVFASKISSFKIFVFVVLGIPITMVGIWLFGTTLTWVLYEVLPKTFTSFSPNYPLFFWILGNMGPILLVYLCFYSIALAIEVENVKEQAIDLYNKSRRGGGYNDF